MLRGQGIEGKTAAALVMGAASGRFATKGEFVGLYATNSSLVRIMSANAPAG
jgi:hypothetical protein